MARDSCLTRIAAGAAIGGAVGGAVVKNKLPLPMDMVLCDESHKSMFSIGMSVLFSRLLSITNLYQSFRIHLIKHRDVAQRHDREGHLEMLMDIVHLVEIHTHKKIKRLHSWVEPLKGAVYGTYEAIRYKVPGLLKIRHIGQTTLGSAAVFGLFLGAGSLIHCGKSY